tara:strand:- start:928 stop:1110 length:183 start_codon:yes stop_codon:yes gene_type:complete
MFGFGKKSRLEKRIDILEKEIELLRSEIRLLKYLWDLKEIEERGKVTHQTIYVDTHQDRE